MTKQTGIERYTVKELRDILGTVYGATLKSYDRKPALLAMLAWRIERDHEMALIIDRQMRRVVDVEEAREQAWIEHELRQSSEAVGYVVTWDDVQSGRELNIARAHVEAVATELNRIELAQYDSTGFSALIARVGPVAGPRTGEALYRGAIELAHAEAIDEAELRLIIADAMHDNTTPRLRAYVTALRMSGGSTCPSKHRAALNALHAEAIDEDRQRAAVARARQLSAWSARHGFSWSTPGRVAADAIKRDHEDALAEDRARTAVASGAARHVGTISADEARQVIERGGAVHRDERYVFDFRYIVDRDAATELRAAPLPGPRQWQAVVAPQLHPVG